VQLAAFKHSAALGSLRVNLTVVLLQLRAGLMEVGRGFFAIDGQPTSCQSWHGIRWLEFHHVKQHTAAAEAAGSAEP
jgi:hypothetical protein